MHQPYSSLIKAYYRPIEAAIRWSNLHYSEQIILARLGTRMRTEQSDFPRWPKLHLNSDRLFCALLNGELAYGKKGVTCLDPNLLNDPELTVCEVHLKAWMKQYFPEEKPKFLYGLAERRGLSWAALDYMSTTRTALEMDLNLCVKDKVQLMEDNTKLNRRISELMCKLEPEEPLSDRGRSVLLNIIGGLLTALRGSSSSGQRYSQFDNDADIIEKIIFYHGGRVGITERTMQKHFAAARRSLAA